MVTTEACRPCNGLLAQRPPWATQNVAAGGQACRMPHAVCAARWHGSCARQCKRPDLLAAPLQELRTMALAPSPASKPRRLRAASAARTGRRIVAAAAVARGRNAALRSGARRLGDACRRAARRACPADDHAPRTEHARAALKGPTCKTAPPSLHLRGPQCRRALRRCRRRRAACPRGCCSRPACRSSCVCSSIADGPLREAGFPPVTSQGSGQSRGDESERLEPLSRSPFFCAIPHDRRARLRAGGR